VMSNFRTNTFIGHLLMLTMEDKRKICTRQRILALPAVEFAERSQIYTAKIVEVRK